VWVAPGACSTRRSSPAPRSRLTRAASGTTSTRPRSTPTDTKSPVASASSRVLFVCVCVYVCVCMHVCVSISLTLVVLSCLPSLLALPSAPHSTVPASRRRPDVALQAEPARDGRGRFRSLLFRQERSRCDFGDGLCGRLRAGPRAVGRQHVRLARRRALLGRGL
jgi:hypothetical protein